MDFKNILLNKYLRSKSVAKEVVTTMISKDVYLLEHDIISMRDRSQFTRKIIANWAGLMCVFSSEKSNDNRGKESRVILFSSIFRYP